MLGQWSDWVPAVTLGAGLLLVQVASSQRDMPLRASLGATVPREIAGFAGDDVDLQDAEVEVAGADAYLLRTYRAGPAVEGFFTLYVGYYESQQQGRTIHSPRNCLPGSGWEVLEHDRQQIETSIGDVTVARYLVRRDEQRALVLYWYQGRGRVESGEYAVKLQLLRDAALRRRTEEALVRVMVPLEGDLTRPLGVATDVARMVIPALYQALPEV